MKVNSKTTLACGIFSFLSALNGVSANPDGPDLNGDPAYAGLSVYLDDYAIDPNEPVKVHVSIPENAGDGKITGTCEDGESVVGKEFGDPGKNYKIEVFQVAPSSGNPLQLIFTNQNPYNANGGESPRLEGEHFALPATKPWEAALDWGDAVEVRPQNGSGDWPSGVYKLSIHLGETDNDCDGRRILTTFVVNPDNASTKPILILDNLYSKAAATDFGGQSLKLFDRDDQDDIFAININRPMQQNIELTRVVSWVDKTYPGKYDVMSIQELEDKAIPTKYKVVIVTGVNSVWTEKGRASFDTYLNAGGNALILGGSEMFWLAEVDGSVLKVNEGAGTKRARYSATKDPENRSTGLSFRHAGFINEPGLLVTGDFQALKHWAYTGTSIKTGSIFGRKIDELSGTFSLAGRNTSGAPVSFEGGVPTVVPGDSGTPQNFEIMAWAKAHNEWENQGGDGEKIGYATPGMFDTGNSDGTRDGYVFNAATSSWGKALWDFDQEKLTTFDDVRVVTKNIVDVFLSEGGPQSDEDKDGIPTAIDPDDKDANVPNKTEDDTDPGDDSGPGDNTDGGDTTGGNTDGSDTNGGDTTGGNTDGSDTNGGDSTGGNTDGSNTGGSDTGGSDTGSGGGGAFGGLAVFSLLLLGVRRRKIRT